MSPLSRLGDKMNDRMTGLKGRLRELRGEYLTRDRQSAQPVIDLEEGLRRLGYPEFRPGQREAIETLLAHRRLLLVAPTGGGKSLIYQLPASLLPGTSLVISPLISLMHDQVEALSARGVAATFLASTLDAAEMRRRMTRMAAGAFRLVYVAPEPLTFPGFRCLVTGLGCPPGAGVGDPRPSDGGAGFR